MANYNLVINSQFQPFSYQEMLHPVQTATQTHQQIEEAYATINNEAAQWEKLANEQGSEQAYQTYKNYANNLRQQADTLAREGLTPLSKQGLNQARADYISQIMPIKTAYDRRMQIRDLQHKGRMQDGDIMYEKEASEIGLDSLIANPNYTPKSYSGKQIYQDTAQMASNLTKRILDDPNQEKWKSILGGQYYELKYGRGLSPAQVLATLEGSPEGSRELANIMNDVISATGISDWDNPTALSKAWDYAKKGAWSAIGQDDIKQLSNKAYDYAMASRRSGGGGGERVRKDPPPTNENKVKLDWTHTNIDKGYDKKMLDRANNITQERIDLHNLNITDSDAFDRKINDLARQADNRFAIQYRKDLDGINSFRKLKEYNHINEVPEDIRKEVSKYRMHAYTDIYGNIKNDYVDKNIIELNKSINYNLKNSKKKVLNEINLTSKEVDALNQMGIDTMQTINIDDIHNVTNSSVTRYTYPEISVGNSDIVFDKVVKGLNKNTVFYVLDGKGGITKDIKASKIKGIKFKPDSNNFNIDDQNIEFFLPSPELRQSNDKLGVRIGDQKFYIHADNLPNELAKVINMHAEYMQYMLNLGEYDIVPIPNLDGSDTYTEYYRDEAIKRFQINVANFIYNEITQYNTAPGNTGNTNK